MESSDFAVKGEKSPRYFFVTTDDVSACLYVTPGSLTHIDHHRERKELLQVAFVTEEVEIPLSSVLVRHGCVQHGGSE